MQLLIHQLARREHLRSGPLPAAFFGSERGGRSKGFALLLTLIVIGVIGAVAFGVGYLTLHSYSATVRFQDSQSALQAAEAGIEDGLLRFRYDRNTEVPYFPTVAPSATSNGCDNTLPEPTDSTKFVLRVNLTTGAVQCLDPTAAGAPTPDPTQIVYDLKIYFKSSKLGDFNATDLSKSEETPEVLKDEVVQLTGIDTANRESIRLRYAMTNLNTSLSVGSDQRGQIQFFTEDGSLLGTRIIHLGDEQEAIASRLGFSFVPLVGTTTLTMKSYIGDRKVAIRTQSNKPIDFGFTSIESNGYANGVKRRWSSTIDRINGAVQGIYNFVLFGGSGSPLGQ